ncbi:HRDC domain-containing protein [Planctomycetota bacterium]|nr:HRDC domain-containing protein [Planctomycetota bacterium]
MPDTTEIVTTPERLDEIIEEFSKADRISLDIESDGFYRYRDSVCIVTLSTPDKNIVLDSLALGEENVRLDKLVERTDIPCLMHSGSNDVAALKRDFGLTFGCVQDTSIAAILLGLTHTGLATLVETYLGIKLSKELQRHNWSARPIETTHVKYLINDTLHLFELHDLMIAEVREKGLMDEYDIECKMTAELIAKPRVFDPERFRRIKGHGDLSPEQRGCLKALYAWRDGVAERIDKAAFRVISDYTLLALVKKQPKSSQALEGFRGVSDLIYSRERDAIMAAIEAGLSEPAPVKLPRDKTEKQLKRLSPRQRDQLGKLKRWREKETESRGIGLQAVLPTPALNDLVTDPPQDIAELATRDRVGSSRAEKYGDAILAILGG